MAIPSNLTMASTITNYIDAFNDIVVEMETFQSNVPNQVDFFENLDELINLTITKEDVGSWTEGSSQLSITATALTTDYADFDVGDYVSFSQDEFVIATFKIEASTATGYTGSFVLGNASSIVSEDTYDVSKRVISYEIDVENIHRDITNTQFGFLNNLDASLQDSLDDIDNTYDEWVSTAASKTSYIDASSIGHANVTNDNFLKLATLTSPLADQVSTIQDSINAVAANTVIDASEIGSKNVTPEEFDTLIDVDSNIQDQIDAMVTALGVLGTVSLSGGTLQIAADRIGEGRISTSNWNYLNDLSDTITSSFTTIDDLLESVGTISDNIFTQLMFNRIAGGSVSSASFGRIDGLNFNTQAQIDKIVARLENIGTITGNQVYVLTEKIGDGDVSDSELSNIRGLTENLQDSLDALLVDLELIGSVSGAQLSVDANIIESGLVGNSEFQRIRNLTQSLNTFLSDYEDDLDDLGTISLSNRTININANRIDTAAGSLSNNEFNRINGLRENAQDQIDNLLDKTTSGGNSIIGIQFDLDRTYSSERFTGYSTPVNSLSLSSFFNPSTYPIIGMGINDIKLYFINNRVSSGSFTIYEIDREGLEDGNANISSVSTQSGTPEAIIWDEYNSQWVIATIETISGVSHNVLHGRNSIGDSSSTITTSPVSESDGKVNTYRNAFILDNYIYYYKRDSSSSTSGTLWRRKLNPASSPERVYWLDGSTRRNTLPQGTYTNVMFPSDTERAMCWREGGNMAYARYGTDNRWRKNTASTFSIPAIRAAATYKEDTYMIGSNNSLYKLTYSDDNNDKYLLSFVWRDASNNDRRSIVGYGL